MNTARTDEMRQSAAAGDWQTVMRLWDEYAGAIREELAQRVCTKARLSEAREFLDWAQRVALCDRAQAQQRLNAIHAVRQYGAQPSPPRSSVRASL